MSEDGKGTSHWTPFMLGALLGLVSFLIFVLATHELRVRRAQLCELNETILELGGRADLTMCHESEPVRGTRTPLR